MGAWWSARNSTSSPLASVQLFTSSFGADTSAGVAGAALRGRSGCARTGNAPPRNAQTRRAQITVIPQVDGRGRRTAGALCHGSATRQATTSIASNNPRPDYTSAMPGGGSVRGAVVIETIESRALVGNPLGDPTSRRTPVWLPPSYAQAPERRYPVIYWLAGYAGTGEMLFSGSPWQPGLGDRLDRLVGSGAMGEVIVVAPDAFTRWGGSQYLDSSAAGAYETYLTAEVVTAIDARFRTRPTREGRAIGGKSSGGYGALVLAMRHPELFSAVASHAGDMYFELSLLPDLPVAARTLRRHGGVAGFVAHFEGREKKDGADFTTMMVLAMAAAYSP